jgi:SAM-dependent methyltransferase
MVRSVIDGLVCPTHGKPLSAPIPQGAGGVPWPDGNLTCQDGCAFPIVGGIPRFVGSHYATSFGLQWRRYQRTQLDSYTGQPYSRARLERCLGAGLESLDGKTVFECGAGAGRFTEWLIQYAESVVSIDLSDAVDANLANCRGKRPYLLLQADINRSPLPKRHFDYVICLGVLQHTPSPEQSIRGLVDHLRPGGVLVIDHYRRGLGIALQQHLSLGFPLRLWLRKADPELALKATIAITRICDPIRKRTNKYRYLDHFVSLLLPSICHYRSYPALDPAIGYEWNELDTHDFLTDYYKHRRSPREIESLLTRLGLTDVVCSRGGNGVEARARMPER